MFKRFRILSAIAGEELRLRKLIFDAIRYNQPFPSELSPELLNIAMRLQAATHESAPRASRSALIRELDAAIRSQSLSPDPGIRSLARALPTSVQESFVVIMSCAVNKQPLPADIQEPIRTPALAFLKTYQSGSRKEISLAFDQLFSFLGRLIPTSSKN